MTYFLILGLFCLACCVHVTGLVWMHVFFVISEIESVYMVVFYDRVPPN